MAQYYLGDQPLSISILGSLHNSHLKWNDQVKFITAKASRILNYLRHSLHTCPLSVQNVVYNSTVHALMEYASPVWYLYSTGDIKHLEAVQHRVARWFVAADGLLFESVGLSHLTIVWTN